VELSKVLEPILPEMAAVEAGLAAVAERLASARGPGPGSSGILREISRHPFSIPGKRLRPALVLLSFRADGDPARRDAAIGLATAVEVLHAASLVHDDIIDGAAERRHQVSLNERYGDRVAVLAGDILYTEFFSLLSGLPLDPATRFRLLELFLGATQKMCVGEILAQEAAAVGRALRVQEYLEISEDKTASLFAACCEGGALLGCSGEERRRSLAEFGLAFGLAFQMLDDLADGDCGLGPDVDLKALAGKYAALAGAAASALGPSFAGVAGLLEYVFAQALSP
jgi:geranylgeranyl pyrophosphate synthase